VGARVLGCSPDTVEAQAAFKAKNSLPFTLIADPEHKVADLFGAYGWRTRPSGEQVQGVLRHSYVIDPEGVVTHVFQQVDPATHAKELLQTLGSS
jgi:thioredoxin-dependent peroxiredoxin